MTDQQKRTAINTATINFAKSVRDNAISKVIDVIETATEPTLLDPQIKLNLWFEPSGNTHRTYYDISRLGNGVIHYYINGTEATAPYSESGAVGGSKKELLFLVESDGTYAEGQFSYTKPDTK